MSAVCSLAWHIRLKQYHPQEEDEEEEKEEERCAPGEVTVHIKEEEEDKEVEGKEHDPAVLTMTKHEDGETEGREGLPSRTLTQIFKEEEQENEIKESSMTQSLPFVKKDIHEDVLTHTLMQPTAKEDEKEEYKARADGGADMCQTSQKGHGEGGAGSALSLQQIRKESDVEERHQKTSLSGQGLKEKTKDSITSTYNTTPIKKEKDKAKREKDEKERPKEKKDKDRSKEKDRDKKDRGKDRDREKDRMRDQEKVKAEGAREDSTPTQPSPLMRKKEDEERTREGSKASQTSLPAQREEKWAKEWDSKTQPHIRREREHDKDRGGTQTASQQLDKEDARDAFSHKHKSSHGKKEKSGHREVKESNAPSMQGIQVKSGREDGKTGASKPPNIQVRKEGKKDKDSNSKEERKKPAPPEHKPPRTLITFDLFKPMEVHQTLSFTDSRPKSHHHSDSRGSSSKPGSDGRTVVSSKGPKVKDSVQGKPAAPLQDTQHSLKQPLKTHTPQTQKDFLI